MEIKVWESGTTAGSHSSHVFYYKVSSQWWFKVPHHLLELVHCIFWRTYSTQPSTRKFKSTWYILLLTSFIEMLISFSSKQPELPLQCHRVIDFMPQWLMQESQLSFKFIEINILFISQGFLLKYTFLLILCNILILITLYDSREQRVLYEGALSFPFWPAAVCFKQFVKSPVCWRWQKFCQE